MTETARSILEHFSQAFPNSAHYRGGRKLRLGKWEKRYPDLSSNLDAKEEFLSAVEELEQLGVLRATWRRFREGTDLEALVLEDAEALYRFLDRPSPETVRRSMLAVLDSPRWAAGEPNGLLAQVRDHLRSLVDAGHPTAVETPESLEDLATLLRCRPQDRDSTPIRALSVRLFNDSKRIEHLLRRADADVRRATGVPISEALGLSRSYPEVSVAVHGALVVDGRRWPCRGEPVTLSRDLVDALDVIEFGEPPRILLVENKETFFVLSRRLMRCEFPSFAGLVYVAGHPHAATISVLDRCIEAGADLHHFGDLDPDGLLILTEMAERTGRRIQPFCMDARVYEAYRRFGYRLSAAAVRRLASAESRLPESMRSLAELIVGAQIGVEQEVIDVDAMME